MKSALLTTTLLTAASLLGIARDASAEKVTGTVTFAGKAEKKALTVDKDQAICGKTPIYDESIVVNDKKGLANVVVVLDGGKQAKPKAGTAVVDQQGCRYLPHVQVVAAGSTLKVKNSDATLHTAHGFAGTNTLFNAVTPSAGTEAKQTLDDPGAVALKCDAGHTWMSAWVFVTDKAFSAVSGADGTFSFDGVAPGTYNAIAWHEKLGEKKAKVTVAAGKAATVTFEYK
jgi:plastocyanin